MLQHPDVFRPQRPERLVPSTPITTWLLVLSVSINVVVNGVKSVPAVENHMERERDESGQYTEQINLEAVLSVFERAEVPVLTASEVADELGCSRPSAYNKLEELEERGELHKKKVGARAVVYIRPNE